MGEMERAAEELKEMVEQHRWIPVSEHEPVPPCIYCDSEGQVHETLGILKCGLKRLTIYLTEGMLDAIKLMARRDIDNIEMCTHIVAWMPLPKPYEEDPGDTRTE